MTFASRFTSCIHTKYIQYKTLIVKLQDVDYNTIPSYIFIVNFGYICLNVTCLDIIQQNEFMRASSITNIGIHYWGKSHSLHRKLCVYGWEFTVSLYIYTLYRFTKLPHSSYYSYHNIANCRNKEGGNDVAARVVLCRGFLLQWVNRAQFLTESCCII